MPQVIIYQNADGGTSVVHPTAEALALVGIEAIAEKDVPHGVPFSIIDKSEVPTNRDARADWRPKYAVNGSGADYGVGSKNNFMGWTKDGKAIVPKKAK